MYEAELQGKLSSKLERSEDILTSNVFSFFKYAPRDIFLKHLLSLLGVDLLDKELEEAEFIFWPTYDDRTEPDLVILAGRHYLLFEAKYFSDFGKDFDKQPEQLLRELAEGSKEARSQNKDFLLIAVTADYCYPRQKFSDIPTEYKQSLRWINWQLVAEILLDILESHRERPPTLLFAEDLYDLLDKKNLRSFMSFDRLRGSYTSQRVENIFFSAKSANFRGQFIGFGEALEEINPVGASARRLFYSKRYFHDLPIVKPVHNSTLFYGEI